VDFRHSQEVLKGQLPDPRNLYKCCRRQELPNPFILSLDNVEIERFMCAQKLDYLKERVPTLWRDHLKQCPAKAKWTVTAGKVSNIERILNDE